MERGIPESMYKKHILELYKKPSNFGILKNATHKNTSYNSACGDEITIQLLIKDGKIKDVKFSGSGCVISLVAASLFTNKIKGMKLKDAKKINKEDILKIFKVKIAPSRIKCALLPLEAVKKALR